MIGSNAAKYSNKEASLGKNQNTYEKHRREAEKKRKAEEKRRVKRLPKLPVDSAEQPPTPPGATE
jgi:hypothetical protein